jgi:hypothetical protein
MTAKPPISFGAVAIEFDELPHSIAMGIERQHRNKCAQLHPGLGVVLRCIVVANAATFRAIRYLLLDKHAGEVPPAAFATAVAPLTRTLLESAMTVVYIYDNPAANTENFYQSGWREAFELHARLAAEHGSDPEWVTRLKDHEAWVASHETDCSITPAHKAKPKLIRYFPTPGKMPNQVRAADRKSFLCYLDGWFYSTLSQDTHLSYMGFARRSSMLADENLDKADAYRSVVLSSAIAVQLAMLSEIIVQVGMPAQARAALKLWGHFAPVPDVASLWKRRYEQLITNLAAT